MTHAQKITSAFRTFLVECHLKADGVYKNLKKYTMFEDDSFDTQICFGSFYLSFTYYRNDISSMILYVERFSPNCKMICFERTGDIIIGRPLDDKINIYNGCSPTAQDMESIGIELETFQYLIDIRAMIDPMLAAIAKKHL